MNESDCNCILGGRFSKDKLRGGPSIESLPFVKDSFFDRGIPSVGDTGSADGTPTFRAPREPFARAGERRPLDELADDELLAESEYALPEVEAALSSGGVACWTVIFTRLGVAFGGEIIPVEYVR
jgi:hypothetical protein